MGFGELLLKTAPLYLLVLFGYLAGRRLKIPGEPVARLLFYVIIPGTVFRGALITPLTPGTLALPVATFGLCAGLCLLFYHLTGRLWADSRRNIAAATAGLGNFGFFGLPLALAVLGPESEGPYIVALLGPMLYNSSVGFMMAAAGRHSAREALARTLRLPTPYAFGLGLLLNMLGWGVPGSVLQLTEAFRGTYTVLGMMMVGISLSAVKSFAPDWPFMAVTLGAKFAAWPAAVLTLAWLDGRTLMLFTPLFHKILVLYAIVPLAGSSAALASLFRTNEDQAASAVLASTLFSVLYIPLALSLL